LAGEYVTDLTVTTFFSDRVVWVCAGVVIDIRVSIQGFSTNAGGTQLDASLFDIFGRCYRDEKQQRRAQQS
jgi:hypothetical protein